MSEMVTWNMEEIRSFLRKLFPFIINDEGQLPNLQDIFRPEAIDFLLMESIKSEDEIDSKAFIDFVIKTGYKDEPTVDVDGKPLLYRTTPVHSAFRCASLKCYSRIPSLFEVYNRFDVNYTDESGLTHFHVACMIQGCDEIVEKFLELGQDPNFIWKQNGESPIHLAMKYGNKKVLELLLRSGANPNLANKYSETPLHLIAQGILEDDIVKIFFMTIDDIQQRLLIDALDGRSKTPLYWAVTYWNKKTVELLLKRGANPNLADEDGFAALHILCNSNWDLVDDFLKMNAEIGQTVNINIQSTVGNTPLHLAVSHGNEIKVVELLLRQGADPNLANNVGGTALHLICKRYGDNDLMKILFEVCNQLKKKVQVDCRDQLGNTPLHFALFHGQKKEVEFLLKRGANPNACNSELLTPLHRIALRGIDDNLAEVFFKILDELQLTVDIHAQDEFNNTPLHLALEHKHKQMSETLLRRGANPYVAGKDGSTALHIICQGDDVNDLAKMFIKVIKQIHQIVHVDTQDNEGNTPLHWALKNGHEQVAGLLLRNGANPNFRNKHGSTPLHTICMREENDYVVQIYFETSEVMNREVQIDARDDLGRTPLELAVVNLLPDVVDTLLERGADLSSFVFPAASYFEKRFQVMSSQGCFCCNLKFRLASGVLAVVERLKKRGYELYLDNAVTIMKVLVKYVLFEKSTDVDESWYDDEHFASEAKNIMITDTKPGLSLYELIRLEPAEAKKRVTYTDYFKLACSKEFRQLRVKSHEAFITHLCEKLTRGFFCLWSVNSLWELMNFRLPIECCDMIIDESLTNKDLYHICLAAAGQNS